MRKRPNPQTLLDRMPKGKPLERIARDVLRSVGLWQLRITEGFMSVRKDQIDPLDPLMAAQRMAVGFIPYLDAYIDAGAGTMLAQLGQDAPDDWLVQNPFAVESARTATLALCQETVDTFLGDLNKAADAAIREAAANATIDAMRTELGDALQSGETSEEIVNRISRWIEDESRWRARRIAVTESARAYNAGAVASTDSLDFVAGYKWILSSDACPICHNVQRLCPVIPKGGTFAENGKNPAYRNVKFPPLHPNCRCTLVPVFDDEVPAEWPKTVMPPPGSSYLAADASDIMEAEAGGYEVVAIGNAR